MAGAVIRKKVRWQTKKRNGGARKWKTAWVEVKVRKIKSGGQGASKA